MAQCIKCKKNVGCGCQLVGGLCSTCRDKDNKKITQNVPNQSNTNSQPVNQ